MVLIARAMAAEPEVLVLDEPMAGLDPAGRDDVFAFIKDYHERHGTTVIFVTHSMEDAARMARRIVVMRDGRIALDGPPHDIFTHAQELIDSGLDVPQVTHVFLELQKRGVPVSEVAYTVGQAVHMLHELKEGRPC